MEMGKKMMDVKRNNAEGRKKSTGSIYWGLSAGSRIIS